MAILSPQIKQGKQNKQDFIEYLASLLPAGNIPNPPDFGMGATFTPSTYQDTGKSILNMLIPEPEDTMFGLMKPNVIDIKNELIKAFKKPVNKINNVEFNRMREKGYTPTSIEDIPLYNIGKEKVSNNRMNIHDKFISKDNVTGYHWSPYKIDDIDDIGKRGNSLDIIGEKNVFGHEGSTPTPYEGFIYSHRDPLEAQGIADFTESGFIYKLTGNAFDRKNPGLISSGSLDEIERIFPIDKVNDYKLVGEYSGGKVIWYEKPKSLLSQIKDYIKTNKD